MNQEDLKNLTNFRKVKSGDLNPEQNQPLDDNPITSERITFMDLESDQSYTEITTKNEL